MDKTEKLREILVLNEEICKCERSFELSSTLADSFGWENRNDVDVRFKNPFGADITLIDFPGFSKTTVMNLYRINLEKHIKHLKSELNKLIK